jgi:hypothetical protein
MPFTPWSSLQDFIDIIDFVAVHGFVAHVDPVQYSIRLLLPPASPLLALPETPPHRREFDEEIYFSLGTSGPGDGSLAETVASCVEAARMPDKIFIRLLRRFVSWPTVRRIVSQH